MLKRSVLFFLALFFASSGMAAYVALSAIGGPFVTDQNILISGSVYDNNNSLKNNIDVNLYAVNNAGAATDVNYVGSVQGTFFRVFPARSAGDYNIIAADLNDNVSARVRITVRSIRTVTAVFFPHNPPFDKNRSEDINFSLQAKTAAGSDTNIMLVARLISDANGQAASPSIDVNANGRDTNAISTNSLPQGLYYIDINSGLAVIPVTVFKFKGFLDLQDDQNNSGTVFGRAKTIFLVLRVTNFDGNVNQTIASVDVNVRSPSGDANSSISCTVTTQARCAYVVPSDASFGDYQVTARITIGSDAITVRRVFSIQGYQLRFFTQSFGGGDMGKEKMPSVYPPNSDVNFEAHFVNTSTGNEVSGNDLNNTFCRDANISVLIKIISQLDQNAIPDTTLYSSANSNYCLVRITAPAATGTYLVSARVPVAGQVLEKTSILNVQKFMVFLSPVDPSTYDPNSPTGKFEFFKGEDIGFRPNIVDLNGTVSPRIVALRQILVRESTQIKTFTGSDINWNTDKNILTLSTAAVSTLTGGFKQIEALVDVNATDALSSGVTAFGIFKLQVLDLGATLSDVNGTAKTSQFGPPSVALDENVFIKVTATTGSSGGISGATVRLKSLRNVFDWNELGDPSIVGSRVTDGNGNAIINIGSIPGLGLGSGGYLAEFEVTAQDGNVDSVDMFFEAHRFMVFLQPVDRASGTECRFAQGFRKDENASFVVQAFDSSLGPGNGDINLSIPSGRLVLYYFGSPTRPQFPPLVISNVNYDVNTAYPCLSFGGQGPPTTKNMAFVTMRRASDQNWEAGFYSPLLRVDANGNSGTLGRFDGNSEIGPGFMRIQSFGFFVNPAQVGQFGPPTGKPGQPFDMNITLMGAVGGRARITARLVDLADGEFIEFGGDSSKDLNIGLQGSCTASSCPTKSMDINNMARRQDLNVVRILIPGNAALSEHLILLTATDTNNNSSDGDVFLFMKLFKLVNFGWWNSLFGVTDLQNAPAQGDWNVQGKTVEQWYKYDPNQGGGGSPQIDFNMLINYTARRFVVDTNRDRNFATETDFNVGNDINNMYRVTDISRVGAQRFGVKFIRKSALDTTESSFGYIGDYPVDQNFTVPILVKDVNGSPIDANVIVSNVAFFPPGSFFPQNLATQSCSTAQQLRACTTSNDFNSWFVRTDANGFVLLPVRIAKAGTFLMLEITVFTMNANGTVQQLQKLQPFEGPMVDIHKYAVSSLVTGPTRTLTYDFNVGTADFNVFDPHRGTIDYNGARFHALAVIGNDRNNGMLGDLNSDLNWYFVKADGNHLLIDDDKNIAPDNPTGDGIGPELGAFGDRACFDLNSSCTILYNTDATTEIYFDHNATDANIFDSNLIIYPVYQNPFGNNGPNKDSNIQLAVSLTDLSGNALNEAYSITSIRLEDFSHFQSTPISGSFNNRTGTTLVNLGNFSSRGAGSYDAVFSLTVGTTTTEQRTHLEVRQPR